jgi:hypothetical protein
MRRARHQVTIALALLCLLARGSSDCLAQASPARTGPPGAGEMPMDDYLGLLARIAPAAGEGARAYVQAWRQRCGRPPTTAELRIATAAGDGDPVLMGMIRASQLRDAAALGSLAARIDCTRGAR